MKTIKNALELIKDANIRETALEYADIWNTLDYKVPSMWHAIYYAFPFDRTKEGASYWDKIAIELDGKFSSDLFKEKKKGRPKKQTV